MPHIELKKRGGKRMGRVSLDGNPVTIGRASSNRLVLSDLAVSRLHCVVELVDGAVRVRDSGSKHGIRVNQRRRTEAALQDGDCITIGPFELTVIMEEAAAAVHAEAGGGGGRDESIEQLTRDLAKAKAGVVQMRRQLDESSQASAASDLLELRRERDQVRAELAVARRTIAALEKQLDAQAESRPAESYAFVAAARLQSAPKAAAFSVSPRLASALADGHQAAIGNGAAESSFWMRLLPNRGEGLPHYREDRDYAAWLAGIAMLLLGLAAIVAATYASSPLTVK